MSINWELVWSSLGPLLTGAIFGTIPLALASFSLGLLLALVVALMRLSRNRLVSAVARTYISVIRGTPLLVQLFVIFYGLAFRRNHHQPLAQRHHRVLPERRRLCRGGHPRGHPVGSEGPVGGRPHHRDVAPARRCVRIILPQAARVSVPPLSNTFISLVKDTSLASLILVTELFRVAQQVAAFSQEFMLLYLEAAVIYWVICLVLASGQSALEKRLDRYVAH